MTATPWRSLLLYLYFAVYYELLLINLFFQLLQYIIVIKNFNEYTILILFMYWNMFLFRCSVSRFTNTCLFYFVPWKVYISLDLCLFVKYFVSISMYPDSGKRNCPSKLLLDRVISFHKKGFVKQFIEHFWTTYSILAKISNCLWYHKAYLYIVLVDKLNML